MKVAMYSGGKDSVYAAWREWPVDMFLFLVYDFSRPSPHILNMGKAVEFGAALAPVLVRRLTRGREFEEKAKLLRSLGVDTIVAGDVDVEEHLKYMERLAAEVGASLKEPLWGVDREELVRREVEVLEFVVIGAKRRELLCLKVDRNNVEDFLQTARRLGFDPAGEFGEYHSQVVRALGAEVAVDCRPATEVGGYYIALV
ncbi:MAG: ATPase [Pyrobaculum sp.]